MGLTVEQECPQCGANIHLEETDRFLRCPHCEVNHAILGGDHFRYVIPAKSGSGENYHVPYLRFRGKVFSCRIEGTGFRVIDVTHLATTLSGLPISLGLRPQALKLHFLNAQKLPGHFLKITERPARVLDRVGRLSGESSEGALFHRAYIGEALSIIYLPLCYKNGALTDAVSGATVNGGLERTRLHAPGTLSKPKWKVKLLPGICPRCGWDLSGESGSLVLTCRNCQSAWEIQGSGFEQVRPTIMRGPAAATAYLPFWCITVNSLGILLKSFADFLRATHQPRLIRREWEKRPLTVWSPGFKIQPKLFLQLVRLFTISQTEIESDPGLPQDPLYPVNLASSEASQSHKVTLAECSIIKRDIVPWLPKIRLQPQTRELVYVPFIKTPHDMVQPQLGFAINNQALHFGCRL